MQKITPFLWFNDNAEESVKFYTSIFKKSKAGKIARYPKGIEKATGRPAGSIMTIEFTIEGLDFVALNGGPHFKFTPAISFFVDCKSRATIDALWKKLSAGGMALMGLDKYPFSERFGWVQDKFGVSWQLNLSGRAQRITPFLMFVGNQHGRAEEAVKFYTSIFKNSKVGKIERYSVAGEPDPTGTAKRAAFSLAGQLFMAFDGGREHPFTFNEAVSFVVNCRTQAEVDYYWKKLIAGGGKEVQCGWLTDKFGVPWQVVPTALGELTSSKDAAKSQRVMEAMLKMVKLDVAKLKAAAKAK